jgi:2-polyprenyl-3-methyl-5-hydroxy-6-metoxy-1,4-benzoquinol methylase
VPKVVNDVVKDDLIYLYLKDEGSGVDYKKITAQDMNQNSIEPVKYDADEDWVAFRYPEKSINISIPDKSDNVLQLALTIK